MKKVSSEVGDLTSEMVPTLKLLKTSTMKLKISTKPTKLRTLMVFLFCLYGVVTARGSAVDTTATPTFTVTQEGALSIRFTPNVGSADHTWDFGDGTASSAYSPLHTYEQEGSYDVCHTAAYWSGGDSSTYCTVIDVNADTIECISDFTYEIDTSDINVPVFTFTAEDTDTSKTYIWNIGGQAMRYGREFDYVFFDAGGWSVVLSVVNGSDTCTTTKVVGAEPASSCFFNYTQPSETSVSLESWMPWYWEDLSYTIDFGDGTIVSDTMEYGTTVEHDYDSSGVFTICQTMLEDSCVYCQDVTIGTVEEEEPTTCNAEFTYTLDTTNTEVPVYTFTATDTDESKTYYWDFEGQRQVYGREVEHVFSDGGGWSVTLTVSDGVDTCKTKEIIMVWGASSCYFDLEHTSDYTVKLSGDLYFSSLNAPFSIDFGDGSTSYDTLDVATLEVEHTYEIDGNYEICLWVGEDSCSYCKSIVIGDPDTVSACDLSFTYVEDSSDIPVYTLSVVNPDPSKAYVWNIETSREAYGSTLRHIFFDNGVWPVTLTEIGDQDTCSTMQYVSATGYYNCHINYSTAYDDTTTYVIEPFFLWSEYTQGLIVNFGDGTSESDVILSGGDMPTYEHSYAQEGVYEVCMTIMSAGEDSSSCSYCTEIVYGNPDTTTTCNLDYTYEYISQTSAGHEMEFYITDYKNTTKYYWTFGTDSIVEADSSAITYTFSQANEYDVCLKSFDGTKTCNVCKQIVIDSVIVSDSLYIEGMVYTDLSPLDGGVVALYKKIDEIWEPVTQVNTDDGHYLISGLENGTYLIYARGDQDLHAAYLPTYFVNGMAWEDAYELELTGSAEDVEITLIRSYQLSQAGEGTISGTVDMSTLDSDEDVILLLKDYTSQNVFKWDVKQNDETFSFEDLPYGKYLITLERPSKSVSQSVEVTANEPDIDVVFKENSVTGLDDDLEALSLAVYPTQVDDYVSIVNNSSKREVLKVDIRSVMGNSVWSNDLNIEAGESREISLQGITSGLLIMYMENEDGAYRAVKLLKK